MSPKAWRLVVDETDADWRLISHYLLLIDFTKHLLQALQLGAEALGRERIPARPSQLAATFQNLDSEFNAFVRMRHVEPSRERHIGGFSPGELSQSFAREPVSACRALLSVALRTAPGGSISATARRRAASSSRCSWSIEGFAGPMYCSMPVNGGSATSVLITGRSHGSSGDI